MRGKRAKQYRKLMQQYGLTFGFREPYQVLVDAQMIQDTESFKMDLLSSLERTLSGKVKPMITQCSIRHLYSLNSPTTSSSLKETLIATAKTMERRRCNHHELESPLGTLECISSVLDPKGSGTNKNRYVIASQEDGVRRFCRNLRGVPLIYVKRSVMVMEPMSEGSVVVRDNTEREKFRQGLRGRVAGLGKRKREDENGEGFTGTAGEERQSIGDDEKQAPKKGTRGPKRPNPLSMKKSKGNLKTKRTDLDAKSHPRTLPEAPVMTENAASVDILRDREVDDLTNLKRKKKRRRPKHRGKDTLLSAEKGEMGDGKQELPTKSSIL